MEKNQNGADMREYVIVNLIMAACIALSVFLGFTWIFLLILIPACMAYVTVRFSIGQVAGNILFAILIPSLLTLSLNLTVVIFSLPPGIMLGLALKKRYGLLKTVSFASAGYLICIAAIVISGLLEQESSFLQAAADAYSQYRAAFLSTSEMLGIDAEQSESMFALLIELLPAMLIFCFGVMGICMFSAVRSVLRRTDADAVSHYRPLCEMRVDKVSIAVSAVMFLVSLFAGGILGIVVENLLVLILGYYMICGYCLMCYYLRPLSAFVRVPIYLLGLVAMLMMPFVFIVIGLWDAVANFRGRGKGAVK